MCLSTTFQDRNSAGTKMMMTFAHADICAVWIFICCPFLIFFLVYSFSRVFFFIALLHSDYSLGPHKKKRDVEVFDHQWKMKTTSSLFTLPFSFWIIIYEEQKTHIWLLAPCYVWLYKRGWRFGNDDSHWKCEEELSVLLTKKLKAIPSKRKKNMGSAPTGIYHIIWKLRNHFLFLSLKTPYTYG